MDSEELGGQTSALNESLTKLRSDPNTKFPTTENDQEPFVNKSAQIQKKMEAIEKEINGPSQLVQKSKSQQKPSGMGKYHSKSQVPSQ